jgi:hypothetical protein
LSNAEGQPNPNLALIALVLRYFPVLAVPQLRTIKVHNDFPPWCATLALRATQQTSFNQICRPDPRRSAVVTPNWREGGEGVTDRIRPLTPCRTAGVSGPAGPRRATVGAERVIECTELIAVDLFNAQARRIQLGDVEQYLARLRNIPVLIPVRPSDQEVIVQRL